MNMSKIKYCSHCGEQMLYEEDFASDWLVDRGDYINYGFLDYPKYDEKTGKRLYVKIYNCPKNHSIINKIFLSKHDKYRDESVEVYTK